MSLIENMNNDVDIDKDNTVDCIQVTLTRSSLHGFGISINDDIDNQSLIISDVIKNGPADGKLLRNDRIINVNGHPVVRYMEDTALKLIHQSTDFVHLIVQRRKHPIILSNNNSPIKYLLNKTRKDEKFGIILDCRYFIKKIYYKNNEIFPNIQEGDEVIKINDIPINRLTLQEAQKLINKRKEQLILYTIPNKIHHQESISSSSKQQQQHILQRSISNHQDFLQPNTGTRSISFFTETSSIGIRLAGGNKYGLFICEIQPNSIAYKAGLFIADKIFSVNNIDFTNLTREEAVLYLMNMKTCQVNMIVSNLQYEYQQLLSDIGGDSFYIRAHFAYNSSNDEELSIHINDIFHVTDTLYNGQVGYWVVTKLNISSSENKLTGTIPNKNRAEKLIENAQNLDELIKGKQPSFKNKLRSKFSDKRSRSVLSLNYFKDDSIFSKGTCWKPMINSKYTTYEQVRLKTITIIRPVILLGPLADIARDRLLNEYPDLFELPQIHIQSSTKAHPSIIKLESIKNVIHKDRHCILDITPSAIEQLNYAECYPIVIYFKASDRRIIKQIRNSYGKFYQKSSRYLYEISEYIEYFYSYLFTSIIKLDSTINWYELLISQIKFQQEQTIWMNNEELIEKDLLKSNEYFISTNYFDEVFFHEQLNNIDFDIINNNSLQRVSSDSIIFEKDNIQNLNEDDDNTFMQNSIISLPLNHHSIIDIPTSDKEYRSLSYSKINKSKINSVKIKKQIPIKFPISNSNERLSSIDSNGSIKKNFIDKSTMTINEKNIPINFSNTWTKSSNFRPTILPNSFKFQLQKPRVYTSDNRIQQQSSTDKNPDETKIHSIEDGCNIIGSARGILDYYGGKLSCPITGVSLHIPIGAISLGIQQEIYFQVYENKSHNQLLSPIVICGPHGIQFNKSIELILPHTAGNNAQQLSLTLHSTNQNKKNLSLLDNKMNNEQEKYGINHITNSNVSILIDHF